MKNLFEGRKNGHRGEHLCELENIRTITNHWVQIYHEKGYRNLPVRLRHTPNKKARKPASEKVPFETEAPTFEDTYDFPEIDDEPFEDIESSEQLHEDHPKSKPVGNDIEDTHKQRQSDQDVELSEDADLLFKDIEGAPSTKNSDSLHNEDIRDKDKTKPLEKEAGKPAGSRIESLNENDDKRSDMRPTNSLVKQFLDLTDTASKPEDHKTIVNPPTKIEPYYVDIKNPATSFVTGNDMEKPLGEDKIAGSPVVEHENVRSSSKTPVHDGKEDNVVSQMKHEKTADSSIEKPLNESDKPVGSPMSNPLNEESAGAETKKPLTTDIKETAGSKMTKPLRNDGKEISGSPLKKPLDKDFKETAGAEQSLQDDFPEYPTADAHAVLDKTRQGKSHSNNIKAHPRFLSFYRRRRYGLRTVGRRRRRLAFSRRRWSIYARRRRRRAVYARRRRRSWGVSRRRRRKTSSQPQTGPDEWGNINSFLTKFRCHIGEEIASMVLTEGCMDRIQRCVRKYNRVAFSKFAGMYTNNNDVEAKDEEKVKDDVFVKNEL